MVPWSHFSFQHFSMSAFQRFDWSESPLATAPKRPKLWVAPFSDSLLSAFRFAWLKESD
jgi:hypothetical protein